VRSVSSWLCKCGVRVKVTSEVDPIKPHETTDVKCPNCGDTQTVYASDVISVTSEEPGLLE